MSNALLDALNLSHLDRDFTDPLLQQAIGEIYATYGDLVSVSAKNKLLLKFGQNENVGTSESTIMELAGSEVAETYVETNAIDSISCTDDNFTGNIYIEGHTISGGLLTFVSQTVAVTGQTRAALTTPLARATRAECADTSTFATPATDKVYIFENGTLSAGVPQTASAVHLIMSANERQTKKASTAISNSDYAIVTKIYADINKKTSALADVRFKVRELTSGQGRRPGGFKTKLIRTLNTSAQGNLVFNPVPYLIVPKNSDVIMTGVASTTAVSISAGFDSFLASVVT